MTGTGDLRLHTIEIAHFETPTERRPKRFKLNKIP